MAKVYLAGPWIDREKMPDIAKVLEANGHSITHPWWQYEGEGEEHETDEFMRLCAVKDYEGVVNADAVVVYNSAKSEGKATEQGIAIAHDKRIILWTPGEKPTSNVFHHMYHYKHVKTLDQVLEALKRE